MKLKSAIALVAAFCLILLGAWLPRIVGNRQDAGNENQVLFAQVEGVELEFAESDMTMSDTLAILGGARDTVEIPQELASLKREKVEKLVVSTVEKYYDAGVLLSDPKENEILFCQTVLYYGAQNQSNVYWLVHYGDPEGGHAFSLTMDDRTGTVCAVEYMDMESEYPVEQMEKVLRCFLQLHLTGLGEPFFTPDVEELLKNAKSPQDGSYLATEYTWETTLYGTGRLTFFVNRTGFYTYFN